MPLRFWDPPDQAALLRSAGSGARGAPHLQTLEQQNAELQQRLAREARRNLDAAVERAIPNCRELDRDPNWHRWLLQPDPYAGVPRHRLLDDAIASGDANRVVASFAASSERPAVRKLAGNPGRRPARPSILASRSSSCTRRIVGVRMPAVKSNGRGRKPISLQRVGKVASREG